MIGIRYFIVLAFLSFAFFSLLSCGGDDDPGPQRSLPALPPSNSLKLQAIVTTGLAAPVFMTVDRTDSSRLFIVEQSGQIRIFNLGAATLNGTPFLNIGNLITSGGEEGLLGMAFDPVYDTNRRFYVFYTDTSSNLVIAQYLRDLNNPDLANATSATVLLTIAHPGQTNHNGGMLAFGPDGCLYAGPGDGGGGGDPNNNAQNLTVLLGKILRLDPTNGAACTFGGTTNPFNSLIWSLGLRNPWRFTFDRQTGDLYSADVGQGEREEVNVSFSPNAGRGVNYGWKVMEGTICFPLGVFCTQSGLTLPVLDYPHASGACSITGGYVYRGAAMPSLSGTYFYADLCNGFVRSFRPQNGQVAEQFEWPLLSPPGNLVTSFGEDAQGEIYLMNLSGGLWRIVPN